MEFVKKHYLKFIYAILALVVINYTWKYFSSLDVMNSKSFIGIAIAMIILVIMTILILIKFNKNRICKQFIVISLIWGVAFAFINPPFLVPDEVVHSYRSYDVAKGRFLYKAHEDYMMLPKGINEYYEKVFNIEKAGINGYVDIIKTPLQKDEIAKYYDNATGGYNVLAYIPQSIGIFIGNALNLPIYFVLVLGRLTNLFTWISLCFLALKFIPIKKDFLFLLMCVPIGIQQAASLSPDALLNSSSFLLIAYILNLKFVKEKIDYIDIGIVTLLTILIGSVKIPYIAISGLLILIPNKKFSFNVFSKVIILLMIIVLNLSVMIGWSKVSKPVKQQQTIVTEEVEVVKESSSDVGMGGAIKKVINEPTIFFEKVGDTLEAAEDFYKRTFTAYFGWFKVLAPDSFVTIILSVLLLFAIKGDNVKYKLNFFDKTIFALMSCGMYLVLCVVALQWSKGAISDIGIFDGIQGRYFIPFIIGLYFILQNTLLKLNINKFWENSIRNLYVAWTLAFSLILIFSSYFIIQ